MQTFSAPIPLFLLVKLSVNAGINAKMQCGQRYKNLKMFLKLL